MIELQVDDDDGENVQQVDVLRGSEVLKGENMSICLVVRRPG